MDDQRKNLPAASGAQSTQLSTLQERLTPATGHEFAREVGPALTLVCPTGMTQDDRKGWLYAAHKVIGDVPLDLLQRGAMAAMRTADHPSKIVPAIMAEISVALELRRDYPRRTDAPTALAPPAPERITAAEREEVGQLMKRLVKRMQGGGETA